MCGPGGVADDVILTSLPSLQEKHKQAIFTKKRWSSGSSTSSGGEEKKAPRSGRGDQEVECKSEAAQEAAKSGEEAGCAGRRREMEGEEEIDSKKKLDEERKSLQKQFRDIEKFTNMEPMLRDSQKE